MDNEIFKTTKFDTLKTKVNKLYKKILDATTLIDINKYKTVGQNLERKNGDADKKIPYVSGSVTAIILDTKIKENDIKIPDLRALVEGTD